MKKQEGIRQEKESLFNAQSWLTFILQLNLAGI